MVTLDERPMLLVFGAGGHAKSVISAIDAANNYRIAALIEEEPKKIGMKVMGYTVAGGLTKLTQLWAEGVHFATVAIGNNRTRARVSQTLIENGFDLTTIIHPLAWIAASCVIGAGSFINVYSVIGPECRIGKGVIINGQSGVGHDSQIADWVHITPGVRIGGGAIIGQSAFLGMGCIILPRIKIGANTFVGANSVVHKDIPDNTTVMGNPAKIIRNFPGNDFGLV